MPCGVMCQNQFCVLERANLRLDKNLGVREKSRLRARSEHSRLGRVGRALVTPQRF